jgi:hypothetical protein
MNRVLSASIIACNCQGEKQKHPAVLTVKQINFGVVGAGMHVGVSEA